MFNRTKLKLVAPAPVWFWLVRSEASESVFCTVPEASFSSSWTVNAMSVCVYYIKFIHFLFVDAVTAVSNNHRHVRVVRLLLCITVFPQYLIDDWNDCGLLLVEGFFAVHFTFFSVVTLLVHHLLLAVSLCGGSKNRAKLLCGFYLLEYNRRSSAPMTL